jgi:glucose-6-phosphate isomerase
MGLPLMLMIGNEQFDCFLDGAYQMDQHFRLADFSQNMPVILALLAIWYRNFFDAQTQAIVPYTYRLRYLIPYLQQAEMESNGKCINLKGEAITYATSPVLFGEEGCLGQHAYHQLLHQGQHLIPVDFIFAGQASNHSPHPHQDIILASGLSQAEALMRGKTYEEARLNLIAKGYTEERAAALAKHQIVPGNKPSNILFIKRLRPQSLGALLALYEHKIFVQSVIWNINPFDQWGIELGKQLLPDILPHVSNYPHKME